METSLGETGGLGARFVFPFAFQAGEWAPARAACLRLCVGIIRTGGCALPHRLMAPLRRLGRGHERLQGDS